MIAGTDAISEPVESTGEIPLSRFGHTMALVGPDKAVLFGGATGDAGKYSMSGDAYVFCMTTHCWSKLAPQGIAPSPRAAHAVATIEEQQMILYGGATGGTVDAMSQ